MSKPIIENTASVPVDILVKLLTPSEVRMLKNRFHILKLLEQGLTIRGIAKKVKVGTDTVVRVARMAEKKGIRQALEVKKQNSTPWIFGKSE